MGNPEAGHTHVLGQNNLAGLLAEVRRTRTAQHETQQLLGASAVHVLPARRASLEALEAYAGALDRHGWPVPLKMRLDMQLLRSLCGRSVSRP